MRNKAISVGIIALMLFGAFTVVISTGTENVKAAEKTVIHEIEPNDYQPSAQKIPAGKVIGRISTGTDSDWYEIASLKKGDKVEITLISDKILRIYVSNSSFDPYGAISKEGYASQISLQMETDDSLYIEITKYNHLGTANYNLTVNVSSQNSGNSSQGGGIPGFEANLMLLSIIGVLVIGYYKRRLRK